MFYIVAAVFLLILTVLLIPLKLELSFIEDFEFRLKYAGFKILPRQNKTSELIIQKTDGQQKQQGNFIKKLFDENDFPTFCKIILLFLKTVFIELKYILKHLKIRKLCTDITVASADAATTALHYGIVSTVFYNFLKFIDSITSLKPEKININSDFEKTKSSFSFSAEIRISPLFLLISEIVIINKYIQFTNREGSALNERK